MTDIKKKIADEKNKIQNDIKEGGDKKYARIVKIALIALIVVVAIVVAIRIIIKNTHTENDERPVVRVTAPETRDIAVYAEQIGTVEPAETVNVLAMVAGEILEVNFNAGDEVKKGDELMVINQDNLKNVEVQLESAKIQLDNAKLSLERTKELYDTGAVSDATMEQVQAAADGAQLSYDAAKSSYDTLMKYSHITAPITGRVEYKNAEVHNYTTQGMPVAVISQIGKNAVTFGVSEDSVNTIKVGDQIIASKDGYESTGTITEINEMIGQNGLYNVKADLDEEGNISTNSKVVVTVMQKFASQAMSVPMTAIYHSGDEAFLYVVNEENKAVKTTVTTGVYDGEYIEIIDGLNAGDNVIYTWSKELYNGADVIVKFNEGEAQ